MNVEVERLDLDLIEQELRAGFNMCLDEARTLIVYCRKLETENRLLRERALAAEQVIHEELPI